MIHLRRRAGGHYDVVDKGLGYDACPGRVIASIRRTVSGASMWNASKPNGEPLFLVWGGRRRRFRSLTAALDATLAHMGIDADARTVVDRMMIESGKAAPRRRA